MIQRIQTVFLLLAVVLISCMMFFPLADFGANGLTYSLRADSLFNLTENVAEMVIWPLFVVLIIMALVPLVTIFLYKKRMYQIRLLIFSSVLNVLFYGLFFYEISAIHKVLPMTSLSYNYWTLLLPIVAILLNILAIRRIGQDEMLIRSLNSNRIR